MQEYWKIIKDYPNYSVSSIGRTRNESTGRILKPQIYNGYFRVSLSPSKNGRSCDRVSVSRLMAEEFLENPNSLPVVNHIDGDSLNNKIHNLEWCNNSHNQKHAYSLGTQKPKRGQDSGSSKLSEKDVVLIISLWEHRTYTQLEIAKRFNVSRGHISSIVRGARWTHLNT